MEYNVTIGIPVYQAEKYIGKALDSVLAQTFESIEILILDDGGTDSSIDIVRRYQTEHARGGDIRIVSQPRNMGIGNARNRIIDEATGKYLFFMDSDDVITPDAIERLYTVAEREQADMVYGSYEQVFDYSDGQQHSEQHCYPSMSFQNQDAYAHYAYDRYDAIQAMVWNILIRLDVFRNNNIRFQPVNFWEDFAVTMTLPAYVTRVVLLPDITYYYYCRYGTLSNFQKRQQILKSEIADTAYAIGKVKRSSAVMKHKSFYIKYMLKIMKTDFYIVCNILKNHDIITPSFTNKELRDMMRLPITWKEVLHTSYFRMDTYLIFLLGKLPPVLSVAVMKMLGKKKGLI